jgi:hypothetical protein
MEPKSPKGARRTEFDPLKESPALLIDRKSPRDLFALLAGGRRTELHERLNRSLPEVPQPAAPHGAF